MIMDIDNNDGYKEKIYSTFILHNWFEGNNKNSTEN
jgi:hypothetical protein